VRARLLGVLSAAAFVATGVAVAPAAVAAGSYTVRVDLPANPHVDDKLVVSGRVVDASQMPVADAAITMTRTDSTGADQPVAMAMPTTTGADGSYSVTDEQPAVWGKVTYAVHAMTLTESGDGSGSVFVHRLPTALSIKASRSIVTFRHSVRVTAHLGTASQTIHPVTIYALPYGGVKKEIASGTVDANGNESATRTVYRRTRFIAHIDGDDKYAPANAYVSVRARAVVGERLRGYYATSGAYRIYHPGRTPELDARLWPNQYHVCLYFRAQYYSNRAWHYASLSPCVRTAADGRAAALLNNALRLPYRLRAEWRGNTVAAANHGRWLHLRFR